MFTDDDRKLAGFKGFYDEWFKLIGIMTHKKAYDLIEERHFTYFGKYKYSGFESFKEIKRRQQKKAREQGG